MRLSFGFRRGRSLLPKTIEHGAEPKSSFAMPAEVRMRPGGEIATSLSVRSDGPWCRVGDEVRYRLREGAPFTFGRALGLGNEPIAHGRNRTSMAWRRSTAPSAQRNSAS